MERPNVETTPAATQLREMIDAFEDKFPGIRELEAAYGLMDNTAKKADRAALALRPQVRLFQANTTCPR